MTDNKIEGLSELKKELEKHNIELEDWLTYIIHKDLLDIKMELVNLRKMLEQVQHTVLLK